jgi:hypothetical protein
LATPQWGVLGRVVTTTDTTQSEEPILGFLNLAQVTGEVRTETDLLWTYRPKRSSWNFLNGIARFPGFEFIGSDGRGSQAQHRRQKS